MRQQDTGAACEPAVLAALELEKLAPLCEPPQQELVAMDGVAHRLLTGRGFRPLLLRRERRLPAVDRAL